MIEAAVLGRVGIDLYPNELETPLSEVRTFTRFVGGFAGNVATGLARLGVRCAIVSRVGNEGNGDFVRSWLAGEGVDVRFLATDPYWQTPATFCEVWPPDRFPLLFYRKPTAPDWQIQPGDFDAEEVAAAGVDAPTLVLKRGERGATVYEHGEETDVPGFPVEVVNGLGAGDAFAAAVGHGLLRGLSLVEAVRRGTVAGAIVASRLACSEAMPRLEELEAALV